MPQTVNGYTIPAGSDAVSTIDDTLATFAGQLPAQGFTTGGGLTVITSQTLTGASSISVNSCFTSTYENYRLVMYVTGTVNNWTSFRFRAAGSDAATNYTNQRLRATGASAAATGTTAATEVYIGEHDTAQSVYVYDILTPQLARQSTIIGSNMRSSSVSDLIFIAGANTASTQFDGFSIIPASGTLTGVLRVYGYKNS